MVAGVSAIVLGVSMAAGFGSTCWASDPSSAVELKLTPDRVSIGPFYDGAEVVAEAVVPLGLDVVLLCTGEEGKLELKKKGKVWGVLWMNVGDLVFERFPSVYILLSSKRLSNIAPEKALDENSLGYYALSKRISCSQQEIHEKSLFKEAIRLKERDGLFYIGEGEISVEAAQENLQKIKGTFLLPPKAPPAEYRVTLLGLRQGRIEVLSVQSFVLDTEGAIAYITSAAENHGLVYGCLAVLLAVCAGLLTGWVFGRRSRKSG